MSAEDTSVNSSAVTTNPKESVSLEDLIKEPENPEERMLMDDEFLQLTINTLDQVQNAAENLLLTTTVSLSELRAPAEIPPEYVEEFKDLVSKVIIHNISLCRTIGVTKVLIKQQKAALNSGSEVKTWFITLIMGLYGASFSQAATSVEPDSCYKATTLDQPLIRFEDYEKMAPNQACGKQNSRVFDVVFNKYEFQKNFNIDPAIAQKGLPEFHKFLQKNLDEAYSSTDTAMMEALLQPQVDAINREFKDLQNKLTNFKSEFLTIARKPGEYQVLVNGESFIVPERMLENVVKVDSLAVRAAQADAIRKSTRESIRSARSNGTEVVPANLASSHGHIIPEEEEALRIVSNQGYGSTLKIYSDALENSIKCGVTLIGCRFEKSGMFGQGQMRCQIKIEGGMMQYDNIFTLIDNFSNKLLKNSIPNFAKLQSAPEEAFGVLATYAGTEKGQISLMSELAITNFQDRLQNLGSNTIQMPTLIDELMKSIKNGLLVNPNLIQVLQNDVLNKIDARFLLKCFDGNIYFPSLMQQLTLGKNLGSFVKETNKPTYKGQLTASFESLRNTKYFDKVSSLFEASADLLLDEGLYFIQRTQTSTHTLINSGFNTVDNTFLTWDKVQKRFLQKVENSADLGFYVLVLFFLGIAGGLKFFSAVKKGMREVEDVSTVGVNSVVNFGFNVADNARRQRNNFGTSGDPGTLTLTNPPSQQTQGNTGTLAIDNGQGNVDRDVQEQPRQPISIANAKASIMNGSRNVFFKNSIPTDTSIGNTTGRLSIAKSANPDKGIIVGDIIVGTGKNIQKYDGPFFGGARTRRHKKRKGASKHYGKRRRGTRKCSKKRRGTRRKRR